MGKKYIVEKIEFLWHGYWQKQSKGLFNHATDMFMDSILNIPYCKLVLEKLKNDYPFDFEEINSYDTTEYWKLFEGADNMRVLSFLYHWYEMKRERCKIKFYYKQCIWLGYSKDISEIDIMQMFKTDIIRPIIDYVIYNLNEKNYVLYLLDRYKQRIKYFGKVKNKIKSIGNNSNKKFLDEKKDIKACNELDLQKDLCLYLFDNGMEVSQEEVAGDGRLDILINSNNEPFIIEVKYIKETEDEHSYNNRVRKAVAQVKDYMLSKGAQSGCIFIYTEVDVNFIGISPNILDVQLHSIYIGAKKPSERNAKNIIVELN